MSRTLIVYSTTDGHTVSICNAIKTTMIAQGELVDSVAIRSVSSEHIHHANRIVVGASIRYGKHQPEVFEFINTHQAALEKTTSAFFTVNLVARKDNKNTPDTNPYIQKFLSQITWQPNVLGVFAGKLDYPRYKLLDKLMIRFIMWMTKGPTDLNTTIEFTDWQHVDEFAHAVLACDQSR